jgi:hypothetical protein
MFQNTFFKKGQPHANGISFLFQLLSLSPHADMAVITFSKGNEWKPSSHICSQIPCDCTLKQDYKSANVHLPGLLSKIHNFSNRQVTLGDNGELHTENWKCVHSVCDLFDDLKNKTYWKKSLKIKCVLFFSIALKHFFFFCSNKYSASYTSETFRTAPMAITLI